MEAEVVTFRAWYKSSFDKTVQQAPWLRLRESVFMDIVPIQMAKPAN